MTDYLYARSSFLGGMARVLDLGATQTIYNDSPTPELADCRAINSDWMAIWKDMEKAIGKVAQRDGE
jgi:hypothetical protein